VTTALEESPGKPYPFDNRNEPSRNQHRGLSALLDEFTTARISNLLDLRGKRCLEVGAGGGSIALWLAEQVGPDGSVLATDLRPQQIPSHDRLTVLQHDLVNEPAPEGEFDLIHARLVLNHLPERREILHRLVGALAPGGVILDEDWDATRTDLVVAAPTPEAAELYRLYQETIGPKILAKAGTDRSWARRVHAYLLDEGLSNVDTYVNSRNWTGGSESAQLVISSLYQLRQQFLDHGITEAQLDQLRELLDDPRLVINGHLLFSTSGQRPA
jgi:ubiquinone/menaquinone biosynthesis C-methylase UbiE